MAKQLQNIDIAKWELSVSLLTRGDKDEQLCLSSSSGSSLLASWDSSLGEKISKKLFAMRYGAMLFDRRAVWSSLVIGL